MKLYATVRSERAKKGQGGNECLNIVVRNESQQCIAHINFFPDNTCRMSIIRDIDVDYDKPITIGTDDDTTGDISYLYERKGKKQKDENCIFHNVENCKSRICNFK